MFVSVLSQRASCSYSRYNPYETINLIVDGQRHTLTKLVSVLLIVFGVFFIETTSHTSSTYSTSCDEYIEDNIDSI